MAGSGTGPEHAYGERQPRSRPDPLGSHHCACVLRYVQREHVSRRTRAGQMRLAPACSREHHAHDRSGEHGSGSVQARNRHVRNVPRFWGERALVLAMARAACDSPAECQNGPCTGSAAVTRHLPQELARQRPPVAGDGEAEIAHGRRKRVATDVAGRAAAWASRAVRAVWMPLPSMPLLLAVALGVLLVLALACLPGQGDVWGQEVAR